jgi:peptidase M48-like protein/PDZ domain-containing protein
MRSGLERRMVSKIFKCAFALVAAVAGFLVSAPADAAPTSLRALAAQNLRLASIAYRISTATVDTCPSPQMVTGLLLHDLSNYDPSDRLAVSRAFQLQSGFGVLQIVPGSAADRAGLRIDDEIVSVNGLRVENPAAVSQPRKSYGRVDGFVQALQSSLGRGPAELMVRRSGNLMRLRLAGELGCGGEVALVRSNNSNAWSDGRRVVVTTGMMRLARNDDELAFVVAHEMAHNILGHVQTSSRSIFGLGLGGKRQELAADYDAVWLMTAAGYRAEGGVSFLRTIRRRFWLNLSLDHPSVGSRLKIVTALASSASAWARAHRPVPVTIAARAAGLPPSLGSRQQQREQLGSAFSVDDSIDPIRTKTALEGDDRLLRLGHVVTKPLKRKQEAGIRPIRIDEIARRARQSEPPLGKGVPREELAGIFLARWGDIRMANDVAAADPVALLDVGDERDQRGDLLVRKRPIPEFVAGIDDLDPDARRIDVGHAAPPRLASVPGALRLLDEAINRPVLVDEIVAGDLRLGRGQAIEGAFGVRHSGIM